MTNNDILKKLRVALHLRNEDIIDICRTVDFRISKSELGALFRTEDHPNYKACGDQILRNFLNGLVIYLRGKREEDGLVRESCTATFKSGAKPSAGSESALVHSNTMRRYEGEVTGEGIVSVISNPVERGETAVFMMELFTGSVKGKQGSVAISYQGFVNAGVMDAVGTVLKGSGTGGFVNMEGKARCTANVDGTGEFTLDFYFSKPATA